MIYVDNLPPIGLQSIIDTLFSRTQKEVLLRHTRDLNVGTTTHCLGRKISHKGNYIDTSLNNNYVHIILEESGMTTCDPAPPPGVSRMRGTAEDEAQQHKQHRRLVGKVQWLAHTRPDISYGAEELARSLQHQHSLTTRSSNT